jgi:hypothetical protein
VLSRYRDDHESQCLYVNALWTQSRLLLRLSQDEENAEVLKTLVYGV